MKIDVLERHLPSLAILFINVCHLDQMSNLDNSPLIAFLEAYYSPFVKGRAHYAGGLVTPFY